MIPQTEQYRKSIGWFSILLGIIIFIVLVITTIILDINIREQTEEKQSNIRQLEEAIHGMVNDAQHPVVIYNAGSPINGDEYIISWPPSAEKLLGWTHYDIMMQGAKVAVPAVNNEEPANVLEEALATRKTIVWRTMGVHKDGTKIPLYVTTRVIGSKMRSVAAMLEAQSNIIELTDDE